MCNYVFNLLRDRYMCITYWGAGTCVIMFLTGTCVIMFLPLSQNLLRGRYICNYVFNLEPENWFIASVINVILIISRIIIPLFKLIVMGHPTSLISQSENILFFSGDPYNYFCKKFWVWTKVVSDCFPCPPR
jgi:fucose 4-O-acetylase-like acetyltransferase